MDEQRFLEACRQIRKDGQRIEGIGTLGEKTLHAVLKRYIEPDLSRHEKKVCGFVADIMWDGEIVEIQTQGFTPLRRKLIAFLQEYKVTVVYPIAQVKWLSWVDPSTGEVTGRRKSPKQGTAQEFFRELVKLRPLLKTPGLRFHILFLELEEYRLLNGWSKDRKKGASRCERIPVRLMGELLINDLPDYKSFLPTGLQVPFTSKEYAAAAKIRLNLAQKALVILNQVGAVKRIGKRANAYLYEPASDMLCGK